ncbi:transposase [Paracoccus sp. S3-43]|uniref:transposase n=1 Tax=Paracoccus sp. S3-43 TaxID=3030011 RepID=UPI0023B1B2FC|nr:transposase [Paracoccus sp. S3-43]WEF24110.1 transposase [Paracoccus sp. S3-43]
MRNALTRIGFTDETSLKTNMAKATGWSPKGARLVDHVPFGHWNTQPFIAALRHDRLDAPWVIDGAMNRKLFELYVETQLAPTLRPGDVIIPDNLSSHKSPKAAATMSAVGAWFLCLPPYSPDLNPIEIIRAFTRTNGVHALKFAKLKALIRRAAARTYEALWQAVGQVCEFFTVEECYNFFIAAGYETD